MGPKPSIDEVIIPPQVISDSYPVLMRLMAGTTPANRQLIRKALVFFQKQFLKAKQERNPVGLAAGQHDACDKAIKDGLARNRDAKDIQCRSGCSHCCHQAVFITDNEAELLVHAVVNEGAPFDVERAKRQATVSFEGWGLLLPEDRACAFLQADGRCGVYEHRPLTCRKLFVKSDPMLCDPITRPGAKVLWVIAPEAEIITAAAHVTTKGDTLPRAMAQVMEARA